MIKKPLLLSASVFALLIGSASASLNPFEKILADEMAYARTKKTQAKAEDIDLNTIMAIKGTYDTFDNIKGKKRRDVVLSLHKSNNAEDVKGMIDIQETKDPEVRLKKVDQFLASANLSPELKEYYENKKSNLKVKIADEDADTVNSNSGAPIVEEPDTRDKTRTSGSEEQSSANRTSPIIRDVSDEPQNKSEEQSSPVITELTEVLNEKRRENATNNQPKADNLDSVFVKLMSLVEGSSAAKIEAIAGDEKTIATLSNLFLTTIDNSTGDSYGARKRRILKNEKDLDKANALAFLFGVIESGFDAKQSNTNLNVTNSQDSDTETNEPAVETTTTNAPTSENNQTLDDVEHEQGQIEVDSPKTQNFDTETNEPAVETTTTNAPTSNTETNEPTVETPTTSVPTSNTETNDETLAVNSNDEENEQLNYFDSSND